MISAIGRNPVIAAPIAAPRIACSEIGESRTRFGPNLSSRPTVALNTPPAAATSSPRNTTRSSRRHLLRDARGDGVAIRSVPPCRSLHPPTRSSRHRRATAAATPSRVSVASSTLRIAFVFDLLQRRLRDAELEQAARDRACMRVALQPLLELALRPVLAPGRHASGRCGGTSSPRSAPVRRPRARALDVLRCAVVYTASASLPSTTTFSRPYALARSAAGCSTAVTAPIGVYSM